MSIKTAIPYVGHNQETINFFIKHFVMNLSNFNRKHYEYCDEHLGYAHHNFLYKEREIYSLAAAAIHKLTPVHQSESRVVKRKDRRNPKNKGLEKEGNGRVDLWAYKDEIEYYFEFKRSYCSIRYIADKKSPDRVSKPWKNLVDQIKQVRAPLKDEPNTCCVGLQMVTPFKSSGSKEALSNSRNIECNEIMKFIGKFQPNPDAAFWCMNDNKSKISPTEWDRNDQESRWVLHPCHLFLFTISWA